MNIRLRLGVLLMAMAVSVCAQQGSGTIQGTVFDPQGAVVPTAAIEVRNIYTNQVFETESNELGSYTAPGLAVGEYEVSVRSAGFKTYIRGGVTLQVNQTALVDASLTVGQLTESVEVIADAAQVDAGSAALGEARRSPARRGKETCRTP